jgi:hypothetical protein
MKPLRFRSASRQRGSIYTTMILAALVAIFLVVVLKIAPAYIDNNVIRNAMQGIQADNDIAAMSLPQLRTLLMRTLNTNRIDFDSSNIVVVRVGTNEYVDINYETRVPLFYNVDAVVKFQNRFEKF